MPAPPTVDRPHAVIDGPAGVPYAPRTISVKELKAAITKLSADELAELVSWLQDHNQRVWDARIEDDLDSGRLDSLLTQVDAEHEAGLNRSL